MKKILIGVLVVLVVGALVLKFINKQHKAAKSNGSSRTAQDELAEHIKFEIEAGKKECKDTIFSPILETDIIDKKNMVYCMSFQSAWNKLIKIINGKIEYLKPNRVGEILNKNSELPEPVSENYLFVKAGKWDEQFVAGVKKESSKFLGHDLNMQINNPPVGTIPDGNFAAFALLKKELRFKNIFNNNLEKGMTFIDKYVISFGEKGKMINRSAEIIDYRNDDDFIIRVFSSTEEDDIILAKVEKEKTLLDITSSVLKRWKSSNNNSFKDLDVLEMPFISLNKEVEFAELIAPIENVLVDGNPSRVAEARQKTIFGLSETGIILESASFVGIVTEGIGPEENEKPRYLVFNKPFLILLKEKKFDMPYFVMWVGNSELMQEAK